MFLNQPYTGSNPVYYSVRVAQQQTIPFHGENITWYFRHWDGDQVKYEDSTQTETAVVFQDANAEAHAVYKGHLASSNEIATAHNNGRRVVRDANGTLHAVYEDGKKIWYTYSTDAGETWAEETVIDNTYGSGISSGGDTYFAEYFHPAIAEHNDYLHVVYVEILYINNEPGVNIFYRKKHVDGPQWGPRITITGFPGPEITSLPKPAIGIFTDVSGEYVITSFNILNQPSEIETYYNQDGGSFVKSTPNITGKSPSIGTREVNNSIYLSYHIEGEIFMRHWTKNTNTWGNAEMISAEASWLSSNQLSNITALSSYPQVCWFGKDDALVPYVVYYDDKHPEELTYFASGPWDGEVHPTISADDGSGYV
nr:hypothetical protein [Gammaproteobacteria bacterium]NIW44631.1 hypothetical protein [Gammaproteobacteria bacterium]NIX01679.1 hypothetical protein [Phycisphaerae bacterium]